VRYVCVDIGECGMLLLGFTMLPKLLFIVSRLAKDKKTRCYLEYLHRSYQSTIPFTFNANKGCGHKPGSHGCGFDLVLLFVGIFLGCRSMYILLVAVQFLYIR